MNRPAQQGPSAPRSVEPPPAATEVRRLHVVELVGAVPPDDCAADASDEGAATSLDAADRLGATRLVERLIAHLGQGEGFRFTALCVADGPFAERLRALGAETVIVPMPDDPPWHAIQVLVGLIRSRRAHVLHAHLPNAHRLAGLAGRITGLPVLSTVHGVQIDMPDLEVHRMVGSQLSVVCEASYYHALGLGIDPERLSCEPVDFDTPACADAAGEADSAANTQSLDSLGQRLYVLAAGVARPAAKPPTSRGVAQARALVQPLTPEGGVSAVSAVAAAPIATASSAPIVAIDAEPMDTVVTLEPIRVASMPKSVETPAPVAIRAVLDELVPGPARRA